MGAMLDIISNDDGLKKDKDKLTKFKALATLFENDMVSNLELTSLQLNDKYNTNDMIGWKHFVNYAPIRQFINDLLLESAEKKARVALSQGEPDLKEALKVKKMADEEKIGQDNSKIVVVFLPKKDFGIGE